MICCLSSVAKAVRFALSALSLHMLLTLSLSGLLRMAVSCCRYGVPFKGAIPLLLFAGRKETALADEIFELIDIICLSKSPRCWPRIERGREEATALLVRNGCEVGRAYRWTDEGREPGTLGEKVYALPARMERSVNRSVAPWRSLINGPGPGVAALRWKLLSAEVRKRNRQRFPSACFVNTASAEVVSRDGRGGVCVIQQGGVSHKVWL